MSVSINPLIEFDPCPLETSDGRLLVGETEQFLTQESKQTSYWRVVGNIILQSLAKSQWMYISGNYVQSNTENRPGSL